MHSISIALIFAVPRSPTKRTSATRGPGRKGVKGIVRRGDNLKLWDSSEREHVHPVVAGGSRASKSQLAIALTGGQVYAHGRPKIEKGNSGQQRNVLAQFVQSLVVASRLNPFVLSSKGMETRLQELRHIFPRCPSAHLHFGPVVDGSQHIATLQSLKTV